MQQYVLPPNSNYSNKLVIVIGHGINFIQYNMYIYTYIYNIESHRFAVVFTVIDIQSMHHSSYTLLCVCLQGVGPGGPAEPTPHE